MKQRSLSTLIVIVAICDTILVGITSYFYLLTRWATGTIYLFIAFTGTFFTFTWYQEKREREEMGNEVKVILEDIGTSESAKEVLKNFISETTGGKFGRDNRNN